MEKRRRVGGEDGNRGVEENTMAILDTFGFSSSTIAHHLNDDRLAYLEAVRTACLLPDSGSSPTPKMLEAIFHIMMDADSLDLIMESYQLFVELDKCFPRVYLSKEEEPVSSSPTSMLSELVVVEESWIPFNFASDNNHGKATNHSGTLVDSVGFHTHVQEIAKVAREMGSNAVETVFLKNMILLQYLIIVLERDFCPRNFAYQENKNWVIVRESTLNLLLGSRKINYKVLMKDCLSLMCDLSELTVSGETSNHDNSLEEISHESNGAVLLALPEVKKSTCMALKKLFVLTMELDSSRRIADQQGLITRADGVRTPVMEIILDELIYNNDTLLPFLQVFDPKWKLQIITQYFQKYIPKSSVQTRRSSEVINTENFSGILKCLSNRNTTKNVIKKIIPEIVQLLLAYGLQAYLVLSNEHLLEGLPDSMEDVKSKSDNVANICKNLISAFTCLRQEDRLSSFSSHAKEALVTAAVVLSSKS
ncbi:negative regulator of systemic acquired resistance SNI1 isoform X1 [Andrographis paniculata]|uniref:negative regulator of systemic acquired resistance SNI1 isoform X1 n=1 Tax=Andrographis paniculata TaxID=175694 RepID=UPI0021E8C8A7|nr:negative regulator of systemic acquired resistance SNI1 isoform X1 [Andrographis paniculata]